MIFSKKIIVISLLLAGLLFNCSENVSAPDSMRLDYVIVVKDTSGITESLSGDVVVQDAQVFANSVSYLNEVSQLSNSNGIARLESILPDIYNFSITKRYSAEEMENATGQSLERILNGQIQELEVVDSDTVEVYLQPASLGKLVFSEIYYTGSPVSPIPNYFHDQFTELYNNSNDTIYLDSLIIADVETGFREEDLVHAVHAYMFPGTGRDYPLAPGEFTTIAQDAIDHSVINTSSIDLTCCDFEYFVPNKADVNADATDMIQIHHKYGNDFLYSVFNNGVIILKVTDPFSYGYDDFDRILLPKDAIMDAVEYRDDLSEFNMKRFDPSLDAGIAGGLQSYSGKSIQRKIDHFDNGRLILMDNNNSTIDFEILDTPTPGWVVEEEVSE